jgi:ammonium transporter, Amt family
MRMLSARKSSAALGGVDTFIILKIVGAVTTLRMSQEDEFAGLDLSQHGERAYNEQRF